jgi:hypothetical protein
LTKPNKPKLLSPSYNSHLVRLAKAGSYHFRIAEDIYVWFLEGHKIVLIGSTAHTVELSPGRVLIEQASVARAQELYEGKATITPPCPACGSFKALYQCVRNNKESCDAV